MALIKTDIGEREVDLVDAHHVSQGDVLVGTDGGLSKVLSSIKLTSQKHALVTEHGTIILCFADQCMVLRTVK